MILDDQHERNQEAFTSGLKELDTRFSHLLDDDELAKSIWLAASEYTWRHVRAALDDPHEALVRWRGECINGAWEARDKLAATRAEATIRRIFDRVIRLIDVQIGRPKSE